jgi:ribose transport system substrate-binding protein
VRQTHSSRLMLISMTIAAVVTISSLSACGGSDDSSSNAGAADGEGVSQAKQIVNQSLQPVEFTFSGEHFDASAARGKSVWFVPISLEVPVEQTWLAALEEALGTVGVNVTAFDGKAEVSEMNRGIDQAIAAKADAIVIGAGPVQLLSGAIGRAQQAGIPVINSFYGVPRIPHDPPGLVAEVTYDYTAIGRLLAAWTVADAEGSPGQVVAFQSSEVDASRPEVAGIESSLDELAPDTEVKVENVPVADWQTRLPTLTQTTVQSNPDLEYMLPLYDGMTLSILPALRQANASDRVKVASLNATPAVLDEIKNDGPMKADVGAPNNWWGWAAADQVLRVLTGNQPVRDEQIPIRLFTADNIDQIDTQGDESTWYGNVDYKGQYKAIWGLG